MHKIIYTIGLLFCATSMFAQSTCTTAFEKAMYNKYNDVFYGIDFSAAHWITFNNESDIDNRKDDLKKLALRLSAKLKMDSLLYGKVLNLDYLKDKNGNIINEANTIKGIYYANEKHEYYRQIQINKEYLKNGNTEEAIKTLAEEIYHACQENEVRKLQRQDFDRKYVELTREQDKLHIKGTKESRVKLALVNSQINNLTQMIGTIKLWEQDFNSEVYTVLGEYRQFIINKNTLADNKSYKALTPSDKISLESNVQVSSFNDPAYINRLQNKYLGLQLEKDAKNFADIIVKVYRTK